MDSSGNDGVWEEFRRHDQRLSANHDSLAIQRTQLAQHSTKIEVITAELRETRSDIAEMSVKLASNSKAFYTAAVAMGGMMLSICGLIGILLSNGA